MIHISIASLNHRLINWTTLYMQSINHSASTNIQTNKILYIICKLQFMTFPYSLLYKLHLTGDFKLYGIVIVHMYQLIKVNHKLVDFFHHTLID